MRIHIHVQDMAKSSDCVENNHGRCQGHFKEEMNGSQVTRMCACPCHDSMYQLVRNTVALMAQAERQNPYHLAQAANDDDGRL
ncbi:hypothetical protein [Candidatus Nitrososphaera evergladensis]|uniref:hypothetical protein n=1 Tax=Candidatus Nitrososphaera evergladensis TaxID=1459637 RepID=UPI0011E5E75D|nr:hypothetical protein [Candidatus Nitrososphaera evergladensis]